MLTALIIAIVIAVVLATALFFQVKASKGQADEQQSLLDAYQQRVDEQQRLLDDYRSLQKNFDNIGQGYEQALELYDKMEEKSQELEASNEKLKARNAELLEKIAVLNETGGKGTDNILIKVSELLKGLDRGDELKKLKVTASQIFDLANLGSQAPAEQNNTVNPLLISAQAADDSGASTTTYVKFSTVVGDGVDAVQLRTNQQMATRALTNLLDNALKFTTDGSVTLTVGVDKENSKLTYAVEDTGCGIAAEDAERVFEPYVKLNSYFDGDGIGLSAARTIARRLGGDVTLAPASNGTGACFTLSLPFTA